MATGSAIEASLNEAAQASLGLDDVQFELRLLLAARSFFGIARVLVCLILQRETGLLGSHRT
jgi:hypothetical protein